jgi:serine/threonine protein kinase
MENLVGRVINERYRVEESIGSSGLAEVYKVWDTRRSTYLALKHLKVDVSKDPEFLPRIKRDVKPLEKLLHPNIVRFHSIEDEGGQIFILMDFVERITLSKAITSSKGVPFTPLEIMEIMQPVCSALHFAHKMGIVHGGLKPVNIMVEKTGWVQVAEFGLARYLSAGITSTAVRSEDRVYMAPEQARGEDPTPQSDIYALGMILYELLTGGKRPFPDGVFDKPASYGSKNSMDVVDLIPVSPRRFNPLISENLAGVMMKCLEKDPKRRFSNGLELLEELQKYLEITIDPKNTKSVAETEALKNEDAPKPQTTPAPPVQSNEVHQKTTPLSPKKRKNLIIPVLVGILLLISLVLFFIIDPLSLLTRRENPIPVVMSSEIARVVQNPPIINTLIPILTKNSQESTITPLPVPTQTTVVPTVQPTMPPLMNESGSGNSNNSGLSAIQGDWIYYRNDSDNGYLYRINLDGTQKERINTDNSYSIVVSGEWVYYRNENAAGRLYRVPAAGGTGERLNDEFSAFINIAGEWVYYQNHTGGDVIYRIRIDGSGREKLTAGQSSFINVINDHVYFVNNSDGHRIYRMRLDGSQMEKLSDDFSSHINIYDDWIYYMTRNLIFDSSNNSWLTESTNINRIRLEGSGKEVLTTTRGGSLNGYVNISNGWIYFIPDITLVNNNALVDINIGGLMYRMRLDGSGRETINNSGCNFINIVGEWIYYRKGGLGGKIHRMHLDGSGEESVS